MAKAQPAMLTEENTPKVKKLPTIKRKTHIDAWIVVLQNQVLVSQIEEVEAAEGEPNCRLVQPFEVTQMTQFTDVVLNPYLMNYSNDRTFMIHSDKIVTLAKPNAELQAKYENLIQE